MSQFFEGQVTQLTTGWYDATVKDVGMPRPSKAAAARGEHVEVVTVQFTLDGHTSPVFLTGTQQFYDQVVLATGQRSRAPSDVVGKRVAVRVEVDRWGNRTTKGVQHIDAPRTSEQFVAERQRVGPPRLDVTADMPGV